ncbi:hypothetical protein [Mycobacterium sp.]|uniref:hypothetical protein n=1 Tax=Mycobacterium sp. TaxID=1785 RepID=UPI003F9B4DD3
MADRLRYHQREKEFWDRVVVITSKDANPTKAHVRYLESGGWTKSERFSEPVRAAIATATTQPMNVQSKNRSTMNTEPALDTCRALAIIVGQEVTEDQHHRYVSSLARALRWSFQSDSS